MMREVMRTGVAVILLAWVSVALPQESSVPAESMPVESTGTPADPAAAYARQAARIRELMAGELDPTVDPASLFAVNLADETAVQIEAMRLGLLARGYGPGKEEPVWQARKELDRAQWEFLSSALDQRERWLRAHSVRQTAGQAERAQREALEAGARARQAEQERARALAEAERARTEAQRIVSEERARLLGFKAGLSERESRLSSSEAEFTRRAEHTLGLRRQVREQATAASNSSRADALYSELRAWLRSTRGLLSDRLSAWPPPLLPVPAAVDDLASELVQPAERSELLLLRTQVGEQATRLQVEERRVAESQMRQLYNAMLGLNDDRLELLDHLSSERRDALTGFGSAGIDQGLAEFRQVALVARYHIHRVTNWAIGDESGRLTVDRVGALIGLLFKGGLVLAAFFWLRRLARQYLEAERGRLDGLRARPLHGENDGGLARIGLRVLTPASWLALELLVWWLMPVPLRALMEARLLGTVLLWGTGGWLAIVMIDAVAEHRARPELLDSGRDNEAIRMRSLRLVGGLVVVAGTVLSVTSQVVGSGTVYSWVVFLCWLLVLPLLILLAGWWREVTFDRLARQRRHNGLESWLIAQQTGWRSRLATTVAVTYLFVRGAWLMLRGWVGQFDFTRRLLAYIFRRNLDRIGERRMQWSHQPLPPSVRASLSPAVPSAELLDMHGSDEVVVGLARRLEFPSGLTALVGERGSGRSTLLATVKPRGRKVVVVDCPFGGLESLGVQLGHAMGVLPGVRLVDLLDTMDSSSDQPVIVVDNVHRLARPVMGGLAELDQLLELARSKAAIAWVFTFERVAWRFLARARSVDLLFDAVVELPEWSEGDIQRLLESRSRQAGVQPGYDLLLPADSVNLDLASREESLREAAHSYCRMIWDYSAGNPGVALQAWSDSLAQTPEGQVVVTPFEAPDMTVFERLPDQGVFVLRAVLQLERAAPGDIAAATQRPPREVAEALHHGVSNGYLEEADGRYAIAWIWYRPLTRFLQRLHLLPNE